MFNNISELETNNTKIEQVKLMLNILSRDYFDKVIEEDSLIIFNYQTNHKSYGSLLNACIDIFSDVFSNNEKEIQALYTKNSK